MNVLLLLPSTRQTIQAVQLEIDPTPLPDSSTVAIRFFGCWQMTVREYANHKRHTSDRQAVFSMEAPLSVSRTD